MIVRCKKFEAKFIKWDIVLEEACKFASEIGTKRLINISHTNGARVVVWYWDLEVSNDKN